MGSNVERESLGKGSSVASFVELFAFALLITSLMTYAYTELSVFGGLVTPVCSYILSESLLCHSTAVEVCPCLVMCCVGNLNPLPAELPW